MKDFYFVDRSWHLLGIATAGGDGVIHIVDDTDDQLISAGARTYSGTIRFTPELSSKVEAMAARGNYILYMDERNKAVFMTIMESSHDPLAGEETFTAEDAGIDLINETVGPYKAQQAMGIADYISLFTNDSGFEIGLNEIPNLKRTLEWTGESDTTLNRILSVATQFDNAELDFSFDVSGTTVVRRLINIHQRIGADRNITLYVDKDINKIVTSGSIYDLYTAVTPTGGTPESKDGETVDQQPITLEGYQWTDPDGRYVLTKEGVLLDPVANQTWSRLLAKGGSPSVNAAYINRVVTYTATSQATLLQSALSDLKTHNHEAVNYETDIAVLPQNINIGDTIHLADEDEHLYLSARLLELKSSYSMDIHTATLGDYLIEHDQVAAQYRQLAEQIKNLPKTVQYYPWLRYADDDQGTNMSALPAGKKYMAVVYSNKSSVPSDNPADYAGKWALIQGPKGDNGVGVPGPKGADGKTSYFHTAYANSIDGKQGFSTTDGNGKSYFGQYVDQTKADSTDPTKYSWALFKGTDGRDGKDGSDNVPVITVGAAYPLGPKKGDMHWLTDNSGVVTGYYTYDGTKWNPYKIDAKILSAETFNGLTFNGVTFNGSRFITPFNGHPKTTGGEEDPLQWTRGIISVGDGEVKMTTTSSKTQNGEATATGLVEMKTGVIYSSQQIANSKEQFEAMLSPGQLFLSHTANNGSIVSGYIDTELVNELNARGRVIWQGGFYPAGNDTIIPSMKLSQTLTGWLVMWSRFENGVIRNNDYAYSIIPRGLVIYQGLGSNYFRVTETMAGHGTFSKTFWLADDRIIGDDGNKQGNAAFAVINNVFAI